jgi:hypothetical protein
VTVRNGGILTAASLTVNQNGTLSGNGTIAANVILSGGTISPGNSPGTLTIDGDLTATSGTFDLELASALLTDQILVLGDVMIGRDTVFNLNFAYAPPANQIFDIEDFFDTGGLFAYDPNFDLAAALNVSGLSAGDSIIVTAGAQRITVGTQIPEPSSLLLFLAGLALVSGGVAIRRWRRIELCG